MLTIIENVHVYEPEDLGRNDIVVCQGKIVEVGPALAPAYPKAKKVNAQGLMAVPGFIDQHVHVTGGGGEGSFKTRVPELKLTDCIRAGVTTLVGVLGTDGITRNVENLLAKTKALNEEGITAYCLTGSYEYPSITLTGDLKKDIAFIKEVLGVKVAISDHRCSHLTKEELIRLASDVRMAALISGKPGLINLHVGEESSALICFLPSWRRRISPSSIFGQPMWENWGRLRSDSLKWEGTLTSPPAQLPVTRPGRSQRPCKLVLP